MLTTVQLGYGMIIGVTLPEDTRKVLGLSLQAVLSSSSGKDGNRFGVFGM